MPSARSLAPTSRRELLRGSADVAVGPVAVALLAACSGTATGTATTAASPTGITLAVNFGDIYTTVMAPSLTKLTAHSINATKALAAGTPVVRTTRAVTLAFCSAPFRSACYVGRKRQCPSSPSPAGSRCAVR